MKIVVAKLVRLGKDGDTFSKDVHIKTLKSNAKVSEDYVNRINSNWRIGGQLYIIDEDATKERDESLNDEKKLSRDELKEKADEMGIDYAKNIKTDSLRKLIDEL